jgi:hypothetical protein
VLGDASAYPPSEQPRSTHLPATQAFEHGFVPSVHTLPHLAAVFTGQSDADVHEGVVSVLVELQAKTKSATAAQEN